MEINKGDFVTRKSYNHDTVFKVINIINDTYYLKGAEVRLYADSNVTDLVKCEKPTEEYLALKENTEIRKSKVDDEYFYLPPKLIHVDSDIFLSNNLSNPYKIRKKAKFKIYKNHQKSSKITQI